MLVADSPLRAGWEVRQLTSGACALLSAMLRRKPLPAATRADKTSLDAFLAMPRCNEHSDWHRVMPGHGLPPRRTVARLATQRGATLHDSLDANGWVSRQAFIQEVAKIKKWYGHPVSTRQTTLPREDAQKQEPKSVLRKEVVARLDRLVHDDVINALELAAVVAEATRKRGIYAYTGNVPTEALWAHLRNAFAHPTQKILKDDLWAAMTTLVFRRFVFQCALGASMPAVAGKDALLAEAVLVLQHEFRSNTDTRSELLARWWQRLS